MRYSTLKQDSCFPVLDTFSWCDAFESYYTERGRKKFKLKKIALITPRCSTKQMLLKFRKVHCKTSAPEFIFEVAGLKPADLFKKKLRYWCFPVNCAKFFRTSSVKNTHKKAASVPTLVQNAQIIQETTQSISIRISFSENIIDNCIEIISPYSLCVWVLCN